MALRHRKKTHQVLGRPPFACVALLLQGGGALGAYQAGVYEALAEAQILPDWIAGISIGAINAALIAGNPPEARVDRLREFWDQVTGNPLLQWTGNGAASFFKGDQGRILLNNASAGVAALSGAPGFFTPRIPTPWLQPNGTIEATSVYDTRQLKGTLERLIDFDRINHDGMRLSVGAVNVRTGNFVYFDTRTHTIRPEHIMASGALPPGFPAIEIEGEHYWDGGLVSNTPLQWMFDSGEREDTLAFQVDLWSARGKFPSNMAEVAVRQKEIQYSSRTRANTDYIKRTQMLRKALAQLLEHLPKELHARPEVELLAAEADHTLYNIVHLIYRAQNYEGDSKDYEFSPLSMQEHWRAGHNDAVRTLRHPEALERPRNREGVFTFDYVADGRE